MKKKMLDSPNTGKGKNNTVNEAVAVRMSEKVKQLFQAAYGRFGNTGETFSRFITRLALENLSQYDMTEPVPTIPESPEQEIDREELEHRIVRKVYTEMKKHEQTHDGWVSRLQATKTAYILCTSDEMNQIIDRLVDRGCLEKSYQQFPTMRRANVVYRMTPQFTQEMETETENQEDPFENIPEEKRLRLEKRILNVIQKYANPKTGWVELKNISASITYRCTGTEVRAVLDWMVQKKSLEVDSQYLNGSSKKSTVYRMFGKYPEEKKKKKSEPKPAPVEIVKQESPLPKIVLTEKRRRRIEHRILNTIKRNEHQHDGWVRRTEATRTSRDLCPLEELRVVLEQMISRGIIEADYRKIGNSTRTSVMFRRIQDGKK